jgi:hypothetical protein
MHIYVSHCYTGVAEDVDSTRQEWAKKVEKSKAAEDRALAEALQLERCLPEYAEYCKAIEGRSQANHPLTEHLLGVRFVVPALGEVQTFNLAARLPGEGKLPVAVAARNWILDAFQGEWIGSLRRPEPFRVTFVGLSGMDNFLKTWALACAAHDQPLPVDLWKSTPRLDLLPDVDVRSLLQACASLQDDEEEQAKYEALLRGWLGSCASAKRDSAILLATAFKLGLQGA